MMSTNGRLEVGVATAGAAGILIFATSMVSLLVVRDAQAQKGLASSSGTGLLRLLEVLAWFSLMLATVILSAALLELPPLLHQLKKGPTADAASIGNGIDGGT